MPTTTTLLYDADCGICRWLLSKILAWDRDGVLRPVPIQSEEGGRLLADLSEGERMASWHLIDPDGIRHSAGAGLPQLFRRLPGGAPLAAITDRAPRVSERGYRWVADHRSRLAKPLTDGARRRADERIAARRRS